MRFVLFIPLQVKYLGVSVIYGKRFIERKLLELPWVSDKYCARLSGVVQPNERTLQIIYTIGKTWCQAWIIGDDSGR